MHMNDSPLTILVVQGLPLTMVIMDQGIPPPIIAEQNPAILETSLHLSNVRGAYGSFGNEQIHRA